MATIKDIAKRLNISVSTVSYALNDGPRKVPDNVKAKVWEVAKELDYRPNRIAKQLVTRKSNTIGIVPDTNVAQGAIGPYVRTVFSATLLAAEEHNKDVLFITGHSDTPDHIYANQLMDGRVDGVIVLTGQRRLSMLDIFDSRQFPYVLINDQGENRERSFCVDNIAGMKPLLHHLHQLGHTKFGLVHGVPDMPDAIQRAEAFDQFIARHDHEHRPEWREIGNFNSVDGRTAGLKILSTNPRPTAIVALNDESAVGVIQAAKELNINVPTQLSVTGFDNTEWVQHTHPTPTTVTQPIEEITTAAVQALIQLIDGKEINGQRFSPSFELRESTSSPPKP